MTEYIMWIGVMAGLALVVAFVHGMGRRLSRYFFASDNAEEEALYGVRMRTGEPRDVRRMQ